MGKTLEKVLIKRETRCVRGKGKKRRLEYVSRVWS